MEQDSIAVVLEAGEAAGVGLDGLDLRVEALREGIGDRVGEVVEQPEQMVLQGQGGFLDGFELRTPCGGEPLLEELHGALRVGLAPELVEGFLVAPGASGLEVALAQLGETQCPLAFGTRLCALPHLNSYWWVAVAS